MYLKQTRNQKTGRTHLSMVQSSRDKTKRYPKTKTLESFGYLDELEKRYADPLAYLKQAVAERNLAEKQDAAKHVVFRGNLLPPAGDFHTATRACASG